jgi:hypothetical protein
MSKEVVIIDGVEYEVHADGVKERKPCRFCEPTPCENEWCPMEDEE